ncbi:MAG: stage II sporulation protein P [Ruminococcus sp.]
MKGKKKVMKLLVLVLAGLCIYNVAQAAKVLQQDGGYGQRLTSQIGIQLMEQAVSVYVPGLLYTEQTQEEEVILEDESTCETILEMNGRTLAERLLGENQKDAVSKENEEALKKKETEEEEKGQTDQEEEVTAQAVTPQFDLSLERLRDFDYLLNHFFVVDPNTTIDAAGLNIDELMGHDLTMKQDSQSPQILIYHTHSREMFADSNPEDMNTGVIGVGEHLAQILREQYGYNVLHDTQAYDVMPDGSEDRSKAYNQARDGLEQILAQNPTIEVIIDLHRDGVSEDTHLVTDIDGKPTAQIMYFNGLSYTNESGALTYLPNENMDANLAFSFRLEYVAASYYPMLTRCVYLKGYRYNLDLRPKSILLEVGAQTNTVEEAMNAMAPFAVILDKVLKGE